MTGPGDPAAAEVARRQVQVLAEEIAALRSVSGDDPRRAQVDRLVAVNVGAIRGLWGLLPGIPAGGDVRRRVGVGPATIAAPTAPAGPADYGRFANGNLVLLQGYRQSAVLLTGPRSRARWR